MYARHGRELMGAHPLYESPYPVEREGTKVLAKGKGAPFRWSPHGCSVLGAAQGRLRRLTIREKQRDEMCNNCKVLQVVTLFAGCIARFGRYFAIFTIPHTNDCRDIRISDVATEETGVSSRARLLQWHQEALLLDPVGKIPKAPLV